MVGKLVAGDLYLHRISLEIASPEDQALVKDLADLLNPDEDDWNVVRIGNDNVAFLKYQDFNETAFPALEKSIRIDLFDGRKRSRSYSERTNPPILHRKELLLPNDHVDYGKFNELTQCLEEYGVFYDTHKIGFRDQWNRRLHSHGVTIDGHKAYKKSDSNSSDVVVERHKTALSRYQLSQPTQLLVRHGVLSNGDTFFDYGCGRGDDVDTLMAGGIVAAGWDPHFVPGNPKVPSDIVNIGFVLNVIENADERRKALEGAWKLTKKALSVAVMAPGAASIQNSKPYKDGFLTTRNTFQKYFTQDQIRIFIQDVTGVEPAPVAPGIFFVFKDEIAFQEFNITRFDRASKRSVQLEGQRKKPISFQPIDRLEKAMPALEALGAEILELGRPLHQDELSPELLNDLKVNRIAFNVALNYCLEKLISREELQKVADARKEDLSLYFALEMFARRKPYRKLPVRLQQDIKYYWGNYANAQVDARELLFSVGKPDILLRAAEDAIDKGLGHLSPEKFFQFHTSMISELPAILRCYVECGAMLYGDIDDADLIKIHIETGKLTLLFYENFEDYLPVLKRRVKINLRAMEVDYYISTEENRQYLYLKSRFLPKDFEGYDSQSRFDKVLQKIEKFDFSKYGPSAFEFDAYLNELKANRM